MPKKKKRGKLKEDDGDFDDGSSESESESEYDNQPAAKKFTGDDGKPKAKAPPPKKLSDYETIAALVPEICQFIQPSNENDCNAFIACPRGPLCKLTSTQDGVRGLHMKQSQLQHYYISQYAKHIRKFCVGEDNVNRERERIGEEEFAARTASVKKELKKYFDGRIGGLNIDDKLETGEPITTYHIVAACCPSGKPCVDTTFGPGKKRYFFVCPNQECKRETMYNEQKGIYMKAVDTHSISAHLLSCLGRERVLDRLLSTSEDGSLVKTTQSMGLSKFERRSFSMCAAAPAAAATKASSNKTEPIAATKDRAESVSCVICRTFSIVS